MVGDGAKLGPLFTVCLFLSYWDLTDRAGQGQLVIRKLWMPGIPARSVNSKGLGVHNYAGPTQMRHSQVILYCDTVIHVCWVAGGLEDLESRLCLLEVSNS